MAQRGALSIHWRLSEMENGSDTGHWGGGDSPYGPYSLDVRPEVVSHYLMRAREERSRVFMALLKAAIVRVRRLLPFGPLLDASPNVVTGGRRTSVAAS